MLGRTGFSELLVESLREQGQSKTSLTQLHQHSCTMMYPTDEINLKLDAVWQRPESDGSDVTVADDDMPQIWWRQYQSWSRDWICQSRASESPADAEPSKTVRYHAPVSRDSCGRLGFGRVSCISGVVLAGFRNASKRFCSFITWLTLIQEGFSCNK